MTTIQLKSDLHRLIDSIEDTVILKAIQQILKKQLKSKSDFWNELPENIKLSIERGLSQADKNELLSNENILLEAKEKYKKVK